MILLVVTAFTGCARLSDETARNAFRESHPNFELLTSYTGEGWDGVAYHYFIYKVPGDPKRYEDMWCFVYQESGEWKVTTKLVRQEVNFKLKKDG